MIGFSGKPRLVCIVNRPVISRQQNKTWQSVKGQDSGLVWIKVDRSGESRPNVGQLFVFAFVQDWRNVRFYKD